MNVRPKLRFLVGLVVGLFFGWVPPEMIAWLSAPRSGDPAPSDWEATRRGRAAPG
jgi:hypothetical protein